MTTRSVRDGRTIEVFADLRCPFTHVGLQRLVARRAALGRHDVRLWVRAWPLELVNDAPLDAAMIAEEVDELRGQVAPDLFVDFDAAHFPTSSIPGLRLAAAAYRHSLEMGEQVSLALRSALFERGLDIADNDVLAGLATDAGLDDAGSATLDEVLADWRDGQQRGVIGSPQFFVGGEAWFCPSFEISRVDGELRIARDAAAFERFVSACFTT